MLALGFESYGLKRSGDTFSYGKRVIHDVILMTFGTPSLLCKALLQ